MAITRDQCKLGPVFPSYYFPVDVVARMRKVKATTQGYNVDQCPPCNGKSYFNLARSYYRSVALRTSYNYDENTAAEL